MDKGEGDLKIAWTFAIMGLVSGFFLGMCFVLFSLFNIFSILGIVCCFAAKKKGNEDTKAAMICSLVGIVLGPVIGFGTMAFFIGMS